MKYSMLLLAVLSLMGLSFQSQATTHVVMVQDFEFVPASMTVSVGDTITWTWVNGIHTTTSTSVPAEAQSWDADITSSATVFSYVVEIEGDYTYICTVHPDMVGSFSAEATTGIFPINAGPLMAVGNTLLQDQLEITYSISSPSTVNISLYDITGVKVKNFMTGFQAAGEYEEVVTVGNLPKGVYFLSLETQDGVVTRKLVMQ